MSRIVIKVAASDLEDVLSNLVKDENFSNQAEYTLEVGIKDIKENYQYLINSPKIKDWDFLKEEKDEEVYNKEKLNLNKPELEDIYEYFVKDENFRNENLDGINRLNYLVEIIYQLKKKSPKFRFTLNNLFDIKTNVVIKLDTKTKIIIDNKYEGVDFKTALIDLINRTNDKWNELELNMGYDSASLVIFILS